MIKNEQNFLVKNEQIYDLLEENEIDFSFAGEIKFFTKFTPREKVFVKQTQGEFVQVKNGEFDKILDDIEVKFDGKIGFLLKKKIYTFNLDGVDYEITEFGEFLSPVCLLSAKFGLEEKLNLPEFLKKIIIKEIKKSDYSDEKLALFGNPDFELNFKDTIKRAKRADDISLFAPGFTKTSQIIQIVFASKFALLKRSLDRYLQKQKVKNLLKIKNNFESIIVLLDKFEYMLNKRIVSNFKKEINYYLDQIYEFQNENYLKKWLSKLPYKTKTMEKRHKDSSIDRLIILFGSERIKNNFDNFEFILQSNNFFAMQKGTSNDTRIVISKLFRISALNTLKNLLKPKFDKQMWQSVFEFKVFCELFLELFCQKDKKIIKKLSKIIKLLELSSQANFANEECEKIGVLAESDTLKTKNLQIKIKQKTPSLFKKIHKLSKSLKIYYFKEI